MSAVWFKANVSNVHTPSLDGIDQHTSMTFNTPGTSRLGEKAIYIIGPSLISLSTLNVAGPSTPAPVLGQLKLKAPSKTQTGKETWYIEIPKRKPGI